MNSAVTCRRTDGRMDGMTEKKNRQLDVRRDTTRVTIASDNFVNSPHKRTDLIKITFTTNIRGKEQTFPCIVSTYLTVSVSPSS